MRKICLLSLCVFFLNAAWADVYMANGIKVGDVTSDSAIIWTRLTEAPERVRSGVEFLKVKLRKGKLRDEKSGKEITGNGQLPGGKSIRDMEGSVPGTEGDVRVTYWPEADEASKKKTKWESVDAAADYMRQFTLDGLKAGTDYVLLVEGRNETGKVSLTGRFRTAPTQDDAEEIDFVVVTCGEYPRRDDLENGHVIYKTMLEQIDPDFFVHTGDIEYYDKPGPYAFTEELARFKWQRLFALPYIRNFHNNVSSYFIKDDHDTTRNDCDPGDGFGEVSWEDGIRLFEEQFPRRHPYKTVRWGKDLQIWIVEGRDFRDINFDNPEKETTIWGLKQRGWLFESFEKSDATFRVILSPTPIVGPDRASKHDNHANEGFKEEGDRIREFLGKQENAYVICGDRHWQYHSVDPKTGAQEFSCGPSSDEHASGYSEKLRVDMHRYLKILGGFLSVNVSRASGKPVISFRHHSPDGDVRYEYKESAK